MVRATDPRDARIRARHPRDLTADPLPFDEVDLVVETNRDEGRAGPRPVVSIRQAKCEWHLSARTELTGVVRNAQGLEVFRPHTKRVGHVSIQCPGTGQLAPESRDS